MARHRPFRSALAVLLVGALALTGWHGPLHLGEHLAAPEASLVEAGAPGSGAAAGPAPCVACVHLPPGLAATSAPPPLPSGPAAAWSEPAAGDRAAHAVDLPARGPRGPPPG